MAVLVFATAFVTLAIEVFYTRLFSALFWKNTAFAILSLAMLGIGASGVLVYLKPAWFTKERAARQIAWLAIASGITVVVSYLWILGLAESIENMLAPVWEFGVLIFAGLTPFFVGGLILSIVFTHHAENIAKLYLFDLVGAALGALLVLPMLTGLNGPLVIPVLALGTVLPGVWFAYREKLRDALIGGIAVAVGLGAIAVAQQNAGVLDVTYTNGKKEEHVVIERWDPAARVTVKQYSPTSVWFEIDSRVVTPIIPFRGNVDEVGFLRRNVLQLAYHLRKYDRVVIIGPGGGSDVLTAVSFGNPDITGVEVNRSIVETVKGELSLHTGNLYNLPQVRIEIADGRAYVAGMSERVDLIQATFIDTFAAAASGAHTLSENYLYTTDAIHDFLDHLNAGGILSMSRWGGKTWGFAETHRAVGLVLAALKERGIDDPKHHIVVMRGATPERLTRGFGYQNNAAGDMQSMATILVKETPFSDSELDKLQTVADDSSFRPLLMAGRSTNDHFLRRMFDANGSPEFYQAFEDTTGMDLRPISDDKPFFFDVIDPIRFLFEARDPRWEKHPYYWASLIGATVMEQLLLATFFLVLALILVPLLSRFRDLRGVRRPVSTLGFFVCLGLGFIGVELAMMQAFSLFLGHPVYSLVVLLASILLFSGLGSLSTSRIDSDFAKHAAVRAGVLVLILCVYGLILRPVTRPLMGMPFAARAVFCMALSFPPAFFMGMMFPLGLREVQRRTERLVPWVWGLNASFSVLGAIASLFIAMSFGHFVTWYVFVAIYALAGVAMARLATAPG